MHASLSLRCCLHRGCSKGRSSCRMSATGICAIPCAHSQHTAVLHRCTSCGVPCSYCVVQVGAAHHAWLPSSTVCAWVSIKLACLCFDNLMQVTWLAPALHWALVLSGAQAASAAAGCCVFEELQPHDVCVTVSAVTAAAGRMQFAGVQHFSCTHPARITITSPLCRV